MTRIIDGSRPIVVAWFPNPDQRDRYLRLLSPTFACQLSRSPNELLHSFMARHTECVLIDAPVGDSEEGINLVRGLARQDATLPVFVLCSSAPSLLRDVASYIRAGATDIIFEAWEPLARTVRGALDRARCSRALNEAFARIAPRISVGMHPIVRVCLELSDARLSVAQVGGRLGLHRNTIALRFARARWPSCPELMQWGRLIRAADELSNGARSIDRVALGLGFSSGSGLAASFHRLTGLRRAEIRFVGREAVIRSLLTRLPPARKDTRSSREE